MPDPTANRGLARILVATAVAGALGYGIQLAVPAFVQPADYVQFGVFWSIVYLVVSALSGIQQEVTRAALPLADGTASSAPRELRAYVVVCTIIAGALIVATGPLWAGRVLGEHAAALVGALAVAACGYTLVATLSGVFYGVRDWNAVAGMTIADAVLRVAAVAVALIVGTGMVALGWAVAVPFALATTILYVVSGRHALKRVQLDVDLRALARNTLRTVIAAVGIGTIISGTPFLLGIAGEGAPARELASVMLVVTLTRAPLVVPLLALQSYLIVTFRDASGGVARRLRLWAGGMLAVTIVLALLAALIGPAVLSLLYGDRYELDSWSFGLIVFGAGLTGIACTTGPAALAKGNHTAYAVGWGAGAVTAVLCLMLPLPLLAVALLAVTLAPLPVIAVHAVSALHSA